MRQEKLITIDGHEYKLHQLGALEGRRIWLKLIRVLAAPIRDLASAGKLNESSIATALAAVVENLDEFTAEEMYVALGRSCEVKVMGNEGERWPKLEASVFDEHFAGRYLAMSQWLGESVVFNFASFFDASSLGKMSALVRKVQGDKSPSPASSTGTSGES